MRRSGFQQRRDYQLGLLGSNKIIAFPTIHRPRMMPALPFRTLNPSHATRETITEDSQLTCSGTPGRKKRYLAIPPEAAPAANQKGDSGCRSFSAWRAALPRSNHQELQGLPAKHVRYASFAERVDTASAGEGKRLDPQVV